MKTLDKHNQQRSEYYARIDRLRRPHPNGIACPRCGAELWDSRPDCVLTSNPPQKDVHCPACGYRGYRLA